MKKLGIIKAYGDEFALFEHTEKESEHWGETRYTRPRIMIAKWLGRRKREETILHELIHIVNECSAVGLSEAKVKRLSYGLYGVLKDNFSINLNRLKGENK